MSVHSESGDAQKAFLAKTQKFIDLLHPDEKPRFGDRCPIGYVKMNLLGRGGNSLVWACRSQMSDEIYAVKQFPKMKDAYDQAADREIQFAEALFKNISPNEKLSEEELKQFPGLGQISRLCDRIDDKEDLWLVYEVGQKTLHERLYKIARESKPGSDEKSNVYTIQHEVFFKILQKDKSILAHFVYRMGQVLDAVQNANIIHSDLKPDNILLRLNSNQTKLEEIKLIDFGSSFKFDEKMEFTATTPEYLSPEMILYLDTLKNKPD